MSAAPVPAHVAYVNLGHTLRKLSRLVLATSRRADWTRQPPLVSAALGILCGAAVDLEDAIELDGFTWDVVEAPAAGDNGYQVQDSCTCQLPDSDSSLPITVNA